jgi:MFS superfamily sulfate permease-like transporter
MSSPSVPKPRCSVNAESVLEAVSHRIQQADPSKVHVVVCDLSASPSIDLAGSRILHQLHETLVARGIRLRIVGAHGRVRDLLRADGIEERVGELRIVQMVDAARVSTVARGCSARRPSSRGRSGSLRSPPQRIEVFGFPACAR